MAQIPTMPQVTGDSIPSLTFSDGETGLLSLSAEGTIIGIPFDQALQQLLTQQETQEGTVLLFAMQQPVDVPETPPALLSGDGKLLPLSLQSDGKALPLMADQLLPAVTTEQVALPQPVKLQQMLQPEQFTMQRLISAEKPLNIASLSTVEDGKLLLEGVRGTEPPAQPLLTALQQSPASSATGRPPLVLPLNVPVGQPGWDKAVGERIQWMVNQNVQQAEIKLTPPNLGPMEIKISMQNDQTSVTFVAAQAPTREALEASIPRLREMFGEINLNLANVDVGHRQAGESDGERAAEGQGAESANEHDRTPSGWSEEGSATVLTGNGLLDTYA